MQHVHARLVDPGPEHTAAQHETKYAGDLAGIVKFSGKPMLTKHAKCWQEREGMGRHQRVIDWATRQPHTHTHTNSCACVHTQAYTHESSGLVRSMGSVAPGMLVHTQHDREDCGKNCVIDFHTFGNLYLATSPRDGHRASFSFSADVKVIRVHQGWTIAGFTRKL